MALARARPVFGPEAARARVAATIREILEQPYEAAKVIADAVKMRDEIACHKPPSGPLDVKLGPGGLIDFEFAVHVLQLTTKFGLDPSLGFAAEMLRDAKLLETKVVDAQKLLTEMLVAIRLLAPESTTPSEESCDLMAKACGSDSWAELLARHDEARQSVLALWERVKGGQLK